MNAPDQDIAVIGAGLAGLVVSYRLQQKGYNVQLYEARSRVGGRILTAQILNLEGEYSYAELGGQNITDGGDAKYIKALIHELGLEISYNRLAYSRLFYCDGDYYDVAELLQKYSKASAKNLVELAKGCKSMQELLDKLFSSNTILKQFVTFLLSAYEGSPADKLCIFHNLSTLENILSGGLSEGHEISGDNPSITMGSIANGNAAMTEKLALKLGERVHLEYALESAHYVEEKITLKFTNVVVRTCDKLVLAIPTPIYKDIIFDDKLISKQQLQHIEKVQYGNVAKIVVPAEHRHEHYNFFASTKAGTFFNDDRKLVNFFFVNDDGKMLDDSKYFREHVTYLKKGFPNSIYNEEAPLSADDLRYTKYTAPVKKSWVSDKFAKGSYSNYGIALAEQFAQRQEISGIEVSKIFAPANDKVFFVGEHATTLPEIGTMEAAVESGERISKMF